MDENVNILFDHEECFRILLKKYPQDKEFAVYHSAYMNLLALLLTGLTNKSSAVVAMYERLVKKKQGRDAEKPSINNHRMVTKFGNKSCFEEKEGKLIATNTSSSLLLKVLTKRATVACQNGSRDMNSNFARITFSSRFGPPYHHRTTSFGLAENVVRNIVAKLRSVSPDPEYLSNVAEISPITMMTELVSTVVKILSPSSDDNVEIRPNCTELAVVLYSPPVYFTAQADLEHCEEFHPRAVAASSVVTSNDLLEYESLIIQMAQMKKMMSVNHDLVEGFQLDFSGVDMDGCVVLANVDHRMDLISQEENLDTKCPVKQISGYGELTHREPQVEDISLMSSDVSHEFESEREGRVESCTEFSDFSLQVDLPVHFQIEDPVHVAERRVNWCMFAAMSLIFSLFFVWLCRSASGTPVILLPDFLILVPWQWPLWAVA